MVALLISALRKPNVSFRTEGFEIYEFGATSMGASSALITNKHYYILSLLFIVFDVELMVLFPYEIVYRTYSTYNNTFILIFLFLLMLGYSYELVSGALTWYVAPTVDLVQRYSILGLFNYYLVKLLCLLISNNIKSLGTFLWRKPFLSRRGLQLVYLNCNIASSYFIINLITNWDGLLYKSQFQFANNTLLYTTKGAIILHITNNLNLPTVYVGYDSFALLLTLVTSILFTLAVLSNWNSELMHSSDLFFLLLS
jgi:NADH:ubiquinone oxidoreductase subunit 3 (subunit A)